MAEAPIRDRAAIDALLQRIVGRPAAPGADLLVAEFAPVAGAPGRWLFVRLHADGAAAAVRSERLDD